MSEIESKEVGERIIRPGDCFHIPGATSEKVWMLIEIAASTTEVGSYAFIDLAKGFCFSQRWNTIADITLVTKNMTLIRDTIVLTPVE